MELEGMTMMTDGAEAVFGLPFWEAMKYRLWR